MFPFCACNALISLRSIFGLSLHHGLTWDWRGGRVEVGDADGAQHGCGALCAVGDGTFCCAVAEIDMLLFCVAKRHGLAEGRHYRRDHHTMVVKGLIDRDAACVLTLTEHGRAALTSLLRAMRANVGNQPVSLFVPPS
jgi:hypothetical protein